jgi:hypothetical protein
MKVGTGPAAACPVAGDVDPAELIGPARQPVQHGRRDMADHRVVGELADRSEDQARCAAAGRAAAGSGKPYAPRRSRASRSSRTSRAISGAVNPRASSSA